jgi:D-3-phosphoglycerate dehydrogenase
VGCGNVGRLIARFAVSLDMNVLASDPRQDSQFLRGGRFQWVDLDHLLAHADIVSLHCPPAPDGVPLINAEALQQMKHGVLLLNTARYELLDPDAVLTALNSDHLAGLALDVFAEEPPLGDPLVDHPHVFATPHIGGYTEESVDRAIHMAIDNLLSELAERKKRTARSVQLQ